MKGKKRRYENGNLRKMLICEAARLMYEEGVKQFHTAKWRAAKNILAQGRKKKAYVRTRDLPSNGEISEQVYLLASMYEGVTLAERLFSMRILALEVMALLEPFSPRLIGSVSTGRVKKNSDIDLHIFTDNIEALETHISSLSWLYEKETVVINYLGGHREFTHIYLDAEFLVELSVYPKNDIRIRTRSSTDGKPIDRMPYWRLFELIQAEHADEWSDYIGIQGEEPYMGSNELGE